VLHNFICAHDPTDIPDDTKMETVSEETVQVDHMTAKLANQAIGNEEQKMGN
jgi:hypothetical protein